MFLENQKISFRQVYRLYLFSLVGISTLIAPAVLAKKNGVYGAVSILLGGGLAFLYLLYLKGITKRMGTDLCTYLREVKKQRGLLARLLMLFLSLTTLFSAGYVARVFAKLMQKSLADEEAYLLILALIVLLGGYAVSGGIESRARVYEILFWIVFLPMLLLLLASLRGMNVIYFQFDRLPDMKKTAKDGCFCFMLFQPLLFSLVLPKYAAKDDRRLYRCIAFALLSAVLTLTAFYLVLLGTFGADALSVMEFPAVAFLSNLQFSGGFLKRMDAIMLGIWFFTLLALMDIYMHYGCVLLCESVGKNGKKRYLLLFLLAVYLTAAGLEYAEGLRQLFHALSRCVFVPAYLALPAVFLLIGRKKG